MIIDLDPFYLIRRIVLVCSIVITLSSCQGKKATCKVPNHWLLENEPNPDLTPKSRVIVDANGNVQLNSRPNNIEELRSTLDKVSRFDRSELLEVRVSSRLACDKAETVLTLIDNSAKCKTSTYCRVGFFD